jgi:hypothetical protein
MALTVREIRAWLDTFTDDTLIGIGEDEMTLHPADERYEEAYLEIGMALSSEYLEQQRPPFVIPAPEIMEAQREATIEDFIRTYPSWECGECGTILPIGEHRSSCSRF